MSVAHTVTFPLQWPAGWKRTKSPRPSAFKVEPSKAKRELLQELESLGARDIVITTNQRINKDGSISIARYWIDDKGVAIYFKRKGRDTVLACDQYLEIHENLRAIGKTIEAMRGIERWGASDMLDRAFTGFEALPAPKPWWELLGLANVNATRDEINSAYRRASQAAHPDRPGGSHDRMAAVNAARDEGLARFGGQIK